MVWINTCKEIKPIKQTGINWYKYKDRHEVLREFGWCLVILKPVNFKECEDNGYDYSEWVSSYGFDKALFHNGDFWIADWHGHGTIKVTNRVVLVANLPREDIRHCQ